MSQSISQSWATLLLGTPVCCTDGDIGTLNGVCLNLATNSFEYILAGVNGQLSYLVHRALISSYRPVLLINCPRTTFKRLRPWSPYRWRSHSRSKACIVTATTAVALAADVEIGRFAGIRFEPEAGNAVREVLLRGTLPIHLEIARLVNLTKNVLQVAPLEAIAR